MIDVGVSEVDGELVGDVDFEARARRRLAVTPHRRGVGPMTITMLLHNTLLAHRQRTRRVSGLRRTPLYEAHQRSSARAWCRSPASRCPCSTARSSRSTRRSASARASSTSRTWASSTSRARGRGRGRAAGELPGRDAAARARALRLPLQRGGGVVDDVTVYRLGDDQLFLCVNAANIEKDYRWIVRHTPAGVEVREPQRRDRRCWRSKGRASARRAGRVQRRGPRRAAPLRVRERQARAPRRRWSRAPATRAATASSCTAARRRAGALGRAARGARARAHASGPRGARHAAARGRAAALRPRARRRDVPARSAPRPLREARAAPRSSVARRSRAESRRATGSCWSDSS